MEFSLTVLYICTKVWERNLDKGKFINIEVLSHDKGFNTMTRITGNTTNELLKWLVLKSLGLEILVPRKRTLPLENIVKAPLSLNYDCYCVSFGFLCPKNAVKEILADWWPQFSRRNRVTIGKGKNMFGNHITYLSTSCCSLHHVADKWTKCNRSEGAEWPEAQIPH